MIIVSICLESGCNFRDGEYHINFEAAIQDELNIDVDIDRIKDCIYEYDGEIKKEITYTFFLQRANIATAYPGYEPAFDILQVLENIYDTNIQL